MRTLNQIAGVGIVANVILNFILIPKYGAVGAAVATLSTQSITAILQFASAYSSMRLKQNVIVIIRYISLAGIVIGVTMFLENWTFAWYLKWGIVLVVSTFAAIFFKLWNIREILTLLKSAKQQTSDSV